MNKLSFMLILIIITFTQVSCSKFEGNTSKSMQEDFDKIRLDHILIISELVNEYKEKVGQFPLALKFFV